MDLIAEICAFNKDRDPERLQTKYRVMRASPFGFLRGTCHLFYDQLPRHGVIKSAPMAWSSGDLHLENFGSFKGDNGLVYFDINDFDEAALAPATFDLVRMLTSVRIAADDSSINASDAEHLCSAFVDSYAAALGAGKSYWIERETARGMVRSLLNGLRVRGRPQFLHSRTLLKGNKRVLRVDGAKALPATQAQRTSVASFVAEFAKTQSNPDFFSIIDVARRVAGTGSLGVDRYTILIKGKGSPDGNYLLDLKQALPSALACRVTVDQPQWRTEADRIVTVQRRMQAVSMAFLHSVRFAEKPFVLRALQPSEDRVTLRVARQSRADLENLVQTMGRLTAWAQLRSAGRAGSSSADELIDFGERRKWRAKLLAASQECAARVRVDANAFNSAYDAGAFSGGSQPLSDVLGPRIRRRSLL